MPNSAARPIVCSNALSKKSRSAKPLKRSSSISGLIIQPVSRRSSQSRLSMRSSISSRSSVSSRRRRSSVSLLNEGSGKKYNKASPSKASASSFRAREASMSSSSTSKLPQRSKVVQRSSSSGGLPVTRHMRWQSGSPSVNGAHANSPMRTPSKGRPSSASVASARSVSSTAASPRPLSAAAAANAQSLRSTVRVYCRFRPKSRIELSRFSEICVSMPNSTNVTIDIPQARRQKTTSHSYDYDRVFGPEATQELVYRESAAPMVENLLEGYNSTILAYGQTGSGKTHTMMGNIDSPEMQGISPRLVKAIFERIDSKNGEGASYEVHASYIEIYMEKVVDLLTRRRKQKSIRIRVGQLEGVERVPVTSAEEMFDVMRIGIENRTVASTAMNKESSRSHSAFIITLAQKQLGATTTSKLYLVDLAGSEKVSKSELTQMSLKEAKSINKSLSALGNVITALTKKGKAKAHIPYRDSKLTYLLRDALGGNCITSLILAASPAAYNSLETLSTLRFGHRAKQIQSKVSQNKNLSAEDFRNLWMLAKEKAERQSREIAELRIALERAGLNIDDILTQTDSKSVANQDSSFNTSMSPPTPEGSPYQRGSIGSMQIPKIDEVSEGNRSSPAPETPNASAQLPQDVEQSEEVMRICEETHKDLAKASARLGALVSRVQKALVDSDERVDGEDEENNPVTHDAVPKLNLDPQFTMASSPNKLQPQSPRNDQEKASDRDGRSFNHTPTLKVPSDGSSDAAVKNGKSPNFFIMRDSISSSNDGILHHNLVDVKSPGEYSYRYKQKDTNDGGETRSIYNEREAHFNRLKEESLFFSSPVSTGIGRISPMSSVGGDDIDESHLAVDNSGRLEMLERPSRETSLERSTSDRRSSVDVGSPPLETRRAVERRRTVERRRPSIVRQPSSILHPTPQV